MALNDLTDGHKCLKDTAVLLIEFQNEWLIPSGKINRLMQDRSQFEKAIKGGRKLLKLSRERKLQIIHSGLRFQPGHPELGKYGLGLRGAIKHFNTFLIGDKGSQWGEGFEPKDGDFVVSGRTGGSAFSGSNLDAYLKANRISRLLIGGFALHVCVESTLRHGHDLGYDCYIVEDAVSAFTPKQRSHVISEVIHHYGATTTVAKIRTHLPYQ